MKLISHRGNIDGIKPEEENKLHKIEKISKLYKVEIDGWYLEGNFFLGHNKSVDAVNYDFLCKHNLIIHSKNIECFEVLNRKKEVETFYQSSELVVITSFGNFLYHANASLKPNNFERSIHVCLNKGSNTEFLNDRNSLITDFVTSYLP